jgi:hypothetical protein
VQPHTKYPQQLEISSLAQDRCVGPPSTDWMTTRCLVRPVPGYEGDVHDAQLHDAQLHDAQLHDAQLHVNIFHTTTWF